MLQVRGGVGGVDARLDDLVAVAHLLRRCAAELTSVAASLVRALSAAQLQATVVPAPISLAAVDAGAAAAVAGPHGLYVVAARLEAVGAALGLAAWGYRAADAAASAALQEAGVVVGVSVGRALGTLVVPAVPGLLAGGILIRRLQAGSLQAGSLQAGSLQAGSPFGRLLDIAATGGPLTEQAVAAVPGVVDGLLVPAQLGPTGALLALALPVRDVPSLAGLIGGLGAVVPGLAEPATVQVRMRPGRESAPPRSLADLTGRIAGCYPPDGSPGPSATVRVDMVMQGPGRRAWVVSIPGQQAMSLRGGTNPFDLAGDVHGMAGRPTASRSSVLAAMEVAGIPPGEPVLLAGHSQGGMVAAGLAADPAVRARYDITHVVTVGSPIGRVPVPDGVQVLAVEHADDAVPRLDGRANPDRANWVTVQRTVHRPGSLADAAQTHDLATYQDTMRLVDGSRDPSVRVFRAALDPFLDHPGATAWTMEIDAWRVPPR